MNATDNNGQTPLHLAAIVGRMDRTEFLLKHGAGLNGKDNDGFTPLGYANKFAHDALAEFLLKRGGKPGRSVSLSKWKN